MRERAGILPHGTPALQGLVFDPVSTTGRKTLSPENVDGKGFRRIEPGEILIGFAYSVFYAAPSLSIFLSRIKEDISDESVRFRDIDRLECASGATPTDWLSRQR